MKNAVIFFTRVPLPGKTKTRLMTALTGEQCAELHGSFIKKIYAACDALHEDTDIILVFTPADEEDRIREVLPVHFEKKRMFFSQEGESLGKRMENAFSRVFSMGYKKAVLIGSDIPELNAGIIREAFSNLENHDIVINPTFDGGYYLIGMKKNLHSTWDIKTYGTGSAFSDTYSHMKKEGLSVYIGTVCRDIDTVKDLNAYMEDGMPEECIGCGRCTESCLFLKKYDINLREFSLRPELAYSCFLCGRCRTVCPVHIDGSCISMKHRIRTGYADGREVKRRFRSIYIEKNPYIFSSYRTGGGKTVLFPGCNFPSFFPKTMDYLEKVLKKRGIGTVYDCCQNPVYQTGMYADSVSNLYKMEQNLLSAGVEEIVVLCPNCYHFLREMTDIKTVSVYRKLHELKLGEMLDNEKFNIFIPCPERRKAEMYEDLKLFISAETQTETVDVQCCGLGGCAESAEPELAGIMADEISRVKGPVYTYCASCAGSFRRKGYDYVHHVLPEILDISEKIPLGIGSLFNRAKKRIKK